MTSKSAATMFLVVYCVVLARLLNYVRGQSMDPRVNITETDPLSDGFRVRGHIADDVLLNCYVENLPDDLQVRWQRTMFDKDGRSTTQDISIDMSVEDNNKWSIEKPTPYSWRLRIKALTINDEGNYTCFVRLTGNNDRAESNRTVFSYDTPLILEAASSSDAFAKEGDEVPLRCNASGIPQPTIMWRRQGNAILPGGGVRKFGSELNIDNVQYDARGLYICEAFNEVGEDRRDIYLTVQHPPKLSALDEQVGQMQGYQRTLVCYIDANPAPSSNEADNQVYWTRGGQRMISDDRMTTVLMDGAFGRLTYELTFHAVSSADYGVYTCTAVTNLGLNNIDIELYESDTPQDDKQGPVDDSGQLSPGILTLTAACLAALTLTLLQRNVIL